MTADYRSNIPFSNNGTLEKTYFLKCPFQEPAPFVQINDMLLHESCPIVLLMCRCPWLSLLDSYKSEI